MDNETHKEPPMKPAYASLATTIRTLEPDALDEKIVDSLRFMLKHPTFAPLRDVIMEKLIDIGEYFRLKDEKFVKTNLEGKPINKPKRTPDGRKKKKKQTATGNGEPALTMDFVTTPEGILVPVKK